MEFLILIGFLLYLFIALGLWTVISDNVIDQLFHKDSVALQGLFMSFGYIVIFLSVPYFLKLFGLLD